MSSIRVSGNAKRDYAAERFQLQIQVQASGTTSGKAVKAGNQAVEAFLRTMQEALAIEPKDWTAGEYSVERSYAAEHEFNFSRSLNLWVEADQNLVQAMTARMEEMENVAFHISFGLDREAEKEQEVLAMAVADARRKAEAIAAALGQRLTGIGDVSSDSFAAEDEAPTCLRKNSVSADGGLAGQIRRPVETNEKTVNVVWNAEPA